MDLNVLQIALENLNSSQFDDWILANDSSLSNYLYKLSSKELLELKFDRFFFSVICNSCAFKEYNIKKECSDQFLSFLTIISVSAEKLAYIGLDSMLCTLLPLLPKTSSFYRLKAIEEFSQVENVRTDYFNKFQIILNLLHKAEIIDDGENTSGVIDVLTFFYKKASSKFNEKGLKNNVDKLKEYYTNQELIIKYPILLHPVIIRLVDSDNEFFLDASDIKRDRLVPSRLISEIFNNINKEYFNHSKIDHSNDSLWGYTKESILSEVLERGRADFTKPYKVISTYEKVLLYCFYNMKKHFFTSYAIFDSALPSLLEFFQNKDYKPIMIDLGCGPMTSGLAMADLIFENTKKGISFVYIGIDISCAMIDRARSFESSDLFDDCEFYYKTNWNEIDYSTLYSLTNKYSPIIFNASYLFSSTSLDPIDLANFIMIISNLYENVYFIFQNPESSDRNKKYREFKNSVAFEEVQAGIEIVRYKTKSYESSEKVYYEILRVVK